MMKAHIISIGNELLIGDTINTNASWIGRFLTERGFLVEEVRTITDDYSTITQSVRHALKHADLVITTGGLGPTHDDITKKAVADLFGSKMVMDEQTFRNIQRIFSSRNRTLSPSGREQAMVPEGCEVLVNEQGTAPGMWFRKGGTSLVLLPGVPYEMKWLMENPADLKIREQFGGQQFRATRYLKTAGVSESELSGRVIGDLSDFIEDGNGIAFLPSPSGVTVRVSRSGTSQEDAEQRLNPLVKHIESRAKGLIYGQGRDLKLSEVTGRILTEKKLTLAAAESCTGGRFSDEITNIPGSSAYFQGSLVTYADAAKIQLLGVGKKTLERHGAVSKQVSLQMAKGVAEAFGADIGVSATGIAGPGGGTDDKPVGTVWMGFWAENQHFALRARFTNDRLINKERTVMVLLETLRRHFTGLGTIPYDLKPKYA